MRKHKFLRLLIDLYKNDTDVFWIVITIAVVIIVVVTLLMKYQDEINNFVGFKKK